MKSKLWIILVIASLVSFSLPGGAAETSSTKTELQALVTQIKGKITDGKRTEKDLADELKEFDVLLAAHKGVKTDDVAQILVMKAILYIEVFDNPNKGIEIVKQIKIDYPETDPGKHADEMIASIEKQEEGKKVQRTLAVGRTFPDFNEKDVAGKPLSVANYKGKIVLIDFWATWCGPCVGELPNVLKTYEKHHSQGFEIIGISLDNEQDILSEFTKKHNVTWQQYFDGKGWQNKLARKYGVNSIPATFLLDGEGKIIAKDLRGEELEATVEKLLKK